MNLANLTKKEIVKRSNFKCKHFHDGLTHPNCYVDKEEKIGFLDIEASNLKANFGIVLSYCIKELDGDVIKNVITTDEIRNFHFDKRLMKEFKDDCSKFTRLVTYYGSRFDIPFLRTRCLHYNLPFPVYSEIAHSDIYMMARGKLCLHSKKLGIVSKWLGIPAKEHPIVEDVWLKAMTGDQKSLDYILVHNVEDVISTEGVWKAMEPYIRITETSI